MKTRVHPKHRAGLEPRERGAVLVIVLWIAFGLVSIALYFGQSMMYEFRAADNTLAGVQAEQAIEGAVRYLCYTVTNNLNSGDMPDILSYQHKEAVVGDARFWLIGRDNTGTPSTEVPYFGLVDEASKLNLNTATIDMLEALPRMTPELAASIIDWRDSDETVTTGGAESETYQRLNQPYSSKNANFETLEELQLVANATPDILYGEDFNRNGLLDPNEDDGDVNPPVDNHDGKLDPGIFEYLTVYSNEPNLQTDGVTARINLNSATAAQQLQALMQTNTALTSKVLPLPGASYTNLLDYFLQNGMTTNEFAIISPNVTTVTNSYIQGLVNVNTASAPVLTALIVGATGQDPNTATNQALNLVAYRQQNPDALSSVAWVAQVITSAATCRQIGTYITSRTYQFSADVAAVGHNGRGYRRAWFVVDTSDGTARVIYRRDLSRLGWALGNVRRQWSLPKDS